MTRAERETIVKETLRTVMQCLEGNFKNAHGNHAFDVVCLAIQKQRDDIMQLRFELTQKGKGDTNVSQSL